MTLYGLVTVGQWTGCFYHGSLKKLKSRLMKGAAHRTFLHSWMLFANFKTPLRVDMLNVSFQK